MTKTDVTQSTQAAQRRTYRPRHRVREEDGTLQLELEVPGADRDGIELSVEGRTLSVRASTRGESVPDDLRLFSAEFEEGDYALSFTLPRNVDADAVRATLEHGILTVALPQGTPERRTIPVDAS